MHEQLSDQIRECLESAAEASAKANAATAPALKAEFLAAEERWLLLARSFGFSESLEDFTAERTFDLKLHTRSRPIHALPLSAEQILRSIVENSDDAIITKNLDGIISSWNKSAERLFGYTAEALLWQIYSRRCSLQIHFRQCGQRCFGGREIRSRMAWRTAGKVG